MNPGTPVEGPAEKLGDLLAVLGAHARSLADGPRRPTRVRIEVRGVALELGWGDTLGDVGGGSPADPPVAAPDRPGWWSEAAVANGTANGSPVAAYRGVPGAPAPVASPESAVPAVSAPAVAGHQVTSPMVGTFYRALEPGASPFVSEGDLVAVDQQVGIVEAMKLMVPIHTDRAGKVSEILCSDATGVEFGTPLLVITDATG